MNDKTILNQLKKDLDKYNSMTKSINDILENWDAYYGKGKKDSIGMTKADNKVTRNMLIGRTTYIKDLIDKFNL